MSAERALYSAIEIVRLSDGVVERVVVMDPPRTERHAEKVDDGINRNLDHSRFYTRMLPEAVA